MTETEMQEAIKGMLEHHFGIGNVLVEQAYLSGCTDLVLVNRFEQEAYMIELKLKPNKQLFDQLERQTWLGKYLVAIAFKPKKFETQMKWEKYSEKIGVNVIWVEHLISAYSKPSHWQNIWSSIDINPRYDGGHFMSKMKEVNGWIPYWERRK